MKNRFESGQALLETAIFMPVFLLCFFGLVWAIQTSTLSERVQLSIRHGGLVSQNPQPYSSYSIYSIYSTIDGKPTSTVTDCTSADQTDLSTNRHTFFHPFSLGQNLCAGGVFYTSTGFANTIILQNRFLTTQAKGPVPNFLIAHGIPGLNSSVIGSQNFFRSPDLPTLTCITGVGDAFKANVEGFYDRSAVSLVLPSALPFHPTTVPIPIHACTKFSPMPSPVPVDTPVVSSPPYTSPPTFVTPTPAPSNPPPVGTPAPTPTPIFTPIPGSSPGNVS